MDKGGICLIPLNEHQDAQIDVFFLGRANLYYVFCFIQDNKKMNKEPNFTKLVFSDTGYYECNVTMGLLSRKASFELVVEGKCIKRNFWKVFLLTCHQGL